MIPTIRVLVFTLLCGAIADAQASRTITLTAQPAGTDAGTLTIDGFGANAPSGRGKLAFPSGSSTVIPVTWVRTENGDLVITCGWCGRKTTLSGAGAGHVTGKGVEDHGAGQNPIGWKG